MTKRSAFLVQVLDKIGAPLMVAIEGLREPANAEQGVKDAQTLAALLGKAVEVSVNLSQTMDLRGNEEDADSIRLALAALAGPLIAEVYKAGRKIPDENDVKRLNKSLEAVLTFSDNFAPAASHIARLKSLDDSGIHADEDQNTIYVMKAMVPVISAVAEFPFGQLETKLVQDIAAKLQAHAVSFAKSILKGAENDPAKIRYVELMVLSTLGQIYADTHKSKTRKLLEAGQDPQAAMAITIESVWASFDLKVAMLESLLGASVPDNVSNAAAPMAPKAPVSESPAVPSSPPPPMPPLEQTPATAAGGPMSFFSKKEEGAVAPAAAAPPAPALSQPQAAPVSAVQPQTAAQTAPPPPAEGGSPMAFFKKKDTSEGA